MEEYRIVLESQLGPRNGTLRLDGKNGAVTGTLTLLGHDNSVSGQWISTHSLHLSHHLHTAVSDLSCVSELELEGEKVFGMLYSNRDRMKLHGEKISKKEDGGEELAAN